MGDVIGGLGLAVPLLLLGFWGLRNASVLAPKQLTAERRARKIRELRRGAVALITLASVVLVVVVVGSVTGIANR